MLRRLATILVVTSLLAAHLCAEEAPTPIRTSLTKVELDFRPSRVSAGLTTLGLFAGMFIASRVALPCHCDDAESVVARGGLIGAIAGATAGIVITLR